MDERVRLAYTAIQLLTLTSNQGGGVQMYVKLSYYGIMRGKLISAVAFQQVCDIMS